VQKGSSISEAKQILRMEMEVIFPAPSSAAAELKTEGRKEGMNDEGSMYNA